MLHLYLDIHLPRSILKLASVTEPVSSRVEKGSEAFWLGGDKGDSLGKSFSEMCIQSVWCSKGDQLFLVAKLLPSQQKQLLIEQYSEEGFRPDFHDLSVTSQVRISLGHYVLISFLSVSWYHIHSHHVNIISHLTTLWRINVINLVWIHLDCIDLFIYTLME